jgi:phage terminase large subunit
VTQAVVDLPEKLVPVFIGDARYRGAHGGRGSGKTRSFAKMTAVRAYAWSKAGRRGVILCGRQYMNSLSDSSLEEIKAAIQSEPWLAEHFDVGEKYVRTRDGRISYVFAGLDRSVDSIKSTARILLAWVDEAEAVTEAAWQILIPTIREEGSELWVTWNPKRKGSDTDKRFRLAEQPDDVKIVQMNWRDNPWFPSVLQRERLADKAERPDDYDHVWEGAYATSITGAYYAASLTKARADQRIGRVAIDPLMTVRAWWDIGGTGAKADATAIWVGQYIGREIRLCDYYEAVGQPLAAHVGWLRSRGYDKALCVLPHDGAQHDKIASATYEGALDDAGFSVRVVPNQGQGAAMGRIEAARRLFPQMHFDAERCAGGIDAIGWYHEKRDDVRGIGLGPAHDWASHGADAFGLVAVDYQPPMQARAIDYSGVNRGIV